MNLRLGLCCLHVYMTFVYAYQPRPQGLFPDLGTRLYAHVSVTRVGTVSSYFPPATLLRMNSTAVFQLMLQSIGVAETPAQS